MGLAESTPALNVAFIDGSIEEPYDLMLCSRGLKFEFSNRVKDS